MQLGFLLMSRNVYAYGTQAMAAYGIGNKVNGLITLPSNGIGSATATIVGQNIGARQQDRAEQGYKISMGICVVFLFIGGMILSRKPISTAIVSIFSEDGEVIAMAADFLSIMAAWCFTNGVYNATIGLFQGTGHTEVTMAVDASQAVGVPLPDPVGLRGTAAYGSAQRVVLRGGQQCHFRRDPISAVPSGRLEKGQDQAAAGGEDRDGAKETEKKT